MIKYILVGVACLLVGIIIGLLIEGARTSLGTLIVDETDPNTDVYRIEINDLDAMSEKKRVILKVVNPHK